MNNIIIPGNDQAQIDMLKKYLDKHFELKDLGDLKFLLGLEVARSTKGIALDQRHYALQLLSDVGYLGCKVKSTSMDPNIKLSHENGELLEDP